MAIICKLNLPAYGNDMLMERKWEKNLKREEKNNQFFPISYGKIYTYIQKKTLREDNVACTATCGHGAAWPGMLMRAKSGSMAYAHLRGLHFYPGPW